MSWRAEAEEIRRRRELAEACGGADAVAKHHALGKLTVRERIAGVLDAGSFQEVGKLAGRGKYDKEGRLIAFEPAPYVMGLGAIDGRPVAIGGEDYTIRAGTGFGSDRRKGGQGGFVEDLAYQYRIPLINLVDGTGGTVNTAKRKGFSVVPGYGQDGFERSVDLMGVVPVVSAVMGTSAGGPSARAILCHFSVMVRGQSQIFAAGPPVVERNFGVKLTKEELGGARVAADTAGTIDNVAASESEAFEMIRRFLSYMPTNVWEMPPRATCADPVDRCEDALVEIIPRNIRQAYNMRRLVEMVVDRDSMFEIQPSFGRAVITLLARMNGHVVGVVANNPMFGGIMDTSAARKQGHFVELCDMFNIPLVFFADIPGFMIGKESEERAVLREGVRARYIGLQVNVPVYSVLVRRCYGMAGGGAIDRRGLNFKIAWPSAEWGSLPLEGGVRAAYKREIESAPDPAAKEKELEAELRHLNSPFLTAEGFGIEDLIDPRETRPYLCRFIDACQPRLRSQLGPRPKLGVRPLKETDVPKREIEGDWVMGWPDRKRATIMAGKDAEGRIINGRAPVLDLEGLITPTDAYYIVNQLEVPEPVHPDDWRLTLSGAIERPLELGLDDLRKLPGRTVRAVTECAGNDAGFFDYLTKGGKKPSRRNQQDMQKRAEMRVKGAIPKESEVSSESTTTCAVSAGEFTGVPLFEVLRRAGLKPSAVAIRAEGFDTGRPDPTVQYRSVGTTDYTYHDPGIINYDKGLPLAKALHPDTLLAWAMNGEYLLHIHGGPVRLVVPGWSGNWWVKWLHKLEITEQMPPCYHQTHYFVLGKSADDPEKKPITAMGVRCIVTDPIDEDSPLDAGEHVIRGLAWSGEGMITRVEVSTDGGGTWRDAHLEEPRERWLWVRWSLLWDAAPGNHRILARATDEQGRVQPQIPWNFQRKLCDWIAPVDVVVR